MTWPVYKQLIKQVNMHWTYSTEVKAMIYKAKDRHITFCHLLNSHAPTQTTETWDIVSEIFHWYAPRPSPCRKYWKLSAIFSGCQQRNKSSIWLVSNAICISFLHHLNVATVAVRQHVAHDQRVMASQNVIWTWDNFRLSCDLLAV